VLDDYDILMKFNNLIELSTAFVKVFFAASTDSSTKEPPAQQLLWVALGSLHFRVQWPK